MRKHALFFALLLAGLVPARSESVLVSHPDLASHRLDAEAVKAVLLGKKVMLGDTRLTIVIVKSSAAQDRFLQKYLGMTTSQFQTHWRRLFMTGGGTAPKLAADEAEACKLLATTVGAIAIAEREASGGLPALATEN